MLHQLHAHTARLGLDREKVSRQACSHNRVHSARFYNEQEAENIKEAISRYEISHPVVADRNMAIWQSYDVSGWPTLVVIDPKGNSVYQQSGEGQREKLDDVVSVLLEKAQRAGNACARAA